jgi:hypothetical protein
MADDKTNNQPPVVVVDTGKTPGSTSTESTTNTFNFGKLTPNLLLTGAFIAALGFGAYYLYSNPSTLSSITSIFSPPKKAVIPPPLPAPTSPTSVPIPIPVQSPQIPVPPVATGPVTYTPQQSLAGFMYDDDGLLRNIRIGEDEEMYEE